MKSYDERYPRIYRALKCYGLSAFYALRVLVDASRGDKQSLFIVRLARHYV